VESNLGLSDWAADRRAWRAAWIVVSLFVLTAVAITPVATIPLPPHFALVAMLSAASLVVTSVTGFLLLFEGRSLNSKAALILASGFFAASLMMIVHIIVFPGFFVTPADDLGRNALLSWIAWHIVLLAAMLVFGFTRPLMPPSAETGNGATVLDLSLVILGVALIVDVELTIAGLARFTAGWYAARFVNFVATVCVMGVLLRQAGTLYMALVQRAEVLEDEAHTDTLTGLPNRRRFDEEFARAFGSGQRRETALAVAIVDIDRFKNYNDSFGHQAGDVALRRIAQSIAESVARSGDVAARYGGEEFVVILEDTSLDGAIAVAERIRTAVLNAGIRTSTGAPLSVSIGVAANRRGDSAEVLLHHADEALYAAKEGGRNRVVAWQPPLDTPPSGEPAARSTA
jgi:diguanylate cyclase (GGDEF)-like protein